MFLKEFCFVGPLPHPPNVASQKKKKTKPLLAAISSREAKAASWLEW